MERFLEIYTLLKNKRGWVQIAVLPAKRAILLPRCELSHCDQQSASQERQVEDDHRYRETPDRLKYMAEVRDVLDLNRDDIPDHTTIYKSFDRLRMWV